MLVCKALAHDFRNQAIVWPRGLYELVMQISREDNNPIIEMTERAADISTGAGAVVPCVERTIRYSGYWYGKVAASNRLEA